MGHQIKLSRILDSRYGKLKDVIQVKESRVSLINIINYMVIFLQMKEAQYIQVKNEVGREAREINEGLFMHASVRLTLYPETAEQLLSFFKAVEIYNQNFPLESTLTAVWKTDWGSGRGRKTGASEFIPFLWSRWLWVRYWYREWIEADKL